MSDGRKKLIYWSGYAVFIVVGCALSWFRILPVQNTSVFLLGLLWLWNGMTLILKINLCFAQRYKRKLKLLFSANIIGLGVAWSMISLSAISNQAIPVIWVTLPFLMLPLLLFLCNKRT